MRPAIFLDRDDTLIDDMNYSADPERIRLKPGAAAALRRLSDAGYALVIVTNQSGIARGKFTEPELRFSHDHLRALLQAQRVTLDGIYYCPYLDSPEAVVETYRRHSDMRKPAPGMLLQAARELDLDLARSWMIGDAPRDAEAGRAAGCRTILVKNARSSAADFSVADLAAAADVVLQNGPPHYHQPGR